ncbi:MAG TPA: hypothetical protein VNN08_12840 [Thermoanaerobaculia bacterium]|nr:hypothetical protein [Thermoanaerobaculia bacterium]
MLGLDMLDVAIGVVFVYLLLSLIASAAAEVWEGIWKMRAVYLERGLKELLHDDDLVASLYNHAIVNGLYEGNYTQDKTDQPSRFAKLRSLLPSGSKLPSYIPARTFALAIMDLLLSSTGTTPAPVIPDAAQSTAAARTAVNTQDVAMRETDAQSSPPSSPLTSPPGGPKSGVVLTPSDDLLINQARHAVILLSNAAGNDAEQARKNIEEWYNNAMDRVSGWYKRRTQVFLFGVGLVLAIVLNVDSIRVVTALSTDKPKRDAIVGIATAYQKENPKLPAAPSTDTNQPAATSTQATSTSTSPLDDPSVAGAKAQTSAALQELDKLGLPIGWKNYGCPLCASAAQCDPVVPFLAARYPEFGYKFGYSQWMRCWLLVLVGWLITALAVSLGAPFWFDMLNKIIVVRSTVKPQEKSGTEAPKDPQKK